MPKGAMAKRGFREKLLKKAEEARSARTVRTTKTPEDYAAARDAAFNAIVHGDKTPENSREADYKLNQQTMLELIDTGASEGFTSAIIYRWRWCRRPSDRAWTFNNVRLRDLLFRPPSDDAGFKDNDTLLEKLQKYADTEYGEGFKIVFKQFGGQLRRTNDGRSETSARPQRINQKFQLTIMWGDPRPKPEDKAANKAANKVANKVADEVADEVDDDTETESEDD